jgi:hypothetical protein
MTHLQLQEHLHCMSFAGMCCCRWNIGKIEVKQEVLCQFSSMHWYTIYIEFWHLTDSRYHNKKNSLENWPTQGCFLMDYEARSRNLGAQQVRRRQSDHYLKDVWSWESSVEGKKIVTLEMLYRSDLTRSWWLRISVHEAQLLCFWGSTAIYGCICQNYTTNQHLATAPSSNSSYCSLPA